MKRNKELIVMVRVSNLLQRITINSKSQSQLLKFHIKFTILQDDLFFLDNYDRKYKSNSNC